MRQATRFIRKLRGDSQPILVEANDGELYVVKFGDNLRGPNLSFNESMGSELFRACGLAVPQWRALIATDCFLDRNRECWLEMQEGRRRPSPGLCFGSGFLGCRARTILEIVPGTATYLRRITNARDFWLAWLLDVCACHSDNRQAVFELEASTALNCIFIDFGHMFGGPLGERKVVPCRAPRYWDGRVYLPVKGRLLMTLRRMVDRFDKDRVWRKIAVIPDEWRTKAAVVNFMECLERLSTPRFVETTLEAMAEYQRSYEREEMRGNQEQERSISLLRSRLQTNAIVQRAVAC